jgi:hypothetical protein
MISSTSIFCRQIPITVRVSTLALLVGLAVPLTLAPESSFAQGNSDNAQQGQENRPESPGQGGPGDDSDGQGPRAGDPAGTGGGQPVWAQEGIPEVELGRLSVIRSPDRVIDQAYDEALASLTDDMVAFYNLDLDDAIYELSVNWDTTTIIDSPLQNLALLEDLLNDSTALEDYGISNDDATLAAIFLGVASDKSVPITEDTVIAVTTIMEVDMTDAEITQLAADAEAVRIAVLTGHG